MRSRFPATAAFILALSAGLSTTGIAQSDSAFLERANDLYTGPDRAVPDARRSDLVLIPVLAKMTLPPEGVDTPLRAALATPSSDAWSAATQWASAAPQQAVIEQIRKVGETLGPGRNFAFLMPYGEASVSDDARSAGVYVRLGDPPVLAGADFRYLRVLDNAFALVNVEATRLASQGNAMDAATLLTRWTHFARQIADREFFAEKRWGVRTTIAGLERLRDLVHEHQDKFTGAQLADIIATLSEDNLGAERLQIPRANLIAGEQILARAFVERQGPSDAFGSTMASASAGDRPLRLFGEASRWQDAASKHANTFETGDALRGVFGDWEYRWRLPEFDRVRKQTSDFDRLAKDRFAAVNLVADGVQEMFDLRQRFRAEAEATRLALGVVGYKLDNGVFPRSLAGIRPRYVRTVGTDPYSETRQEFHYFVPIRDQPRADRELPRPHEISFALPEGTPITSDDPFAAAGFSRASLGSLKTFREEVTTARRELSEMQAETQEMRDRIDEVPAQARGQAQAMLDLMTLAMSFVDKLLQSPEVKRIMDVSDPESVPTAESERMLAAVATRVTEIQKEILAAAPAETRSAIESMLAEQKSSIPIGLRDDTFILYSAGVDQQRQWATRVGEGAPDLLFWPPALSLFRDQFDSVGAQPDAIAAHWLWITPSTRGGSSAAP